MTESTPFGHTAPVDTALPAPGFAARAQTPVAFAELYEQTVDVAWRMLCRLGVGSADLEDAVQDVFVIAHRRLGTLHPTARPSTWVGGIAVRVAHDYRRRRARKPVEPLEAHASTVEDLRERPDDAVARAQAVDLFERLLAQLVPEQREVFVLAELERWSAPEIAQATGEKLNTVYSRLRLARERINALVTALDRGLP